MPRNLLRLVPVTAILSFVVVGGWLLSTQTPSYAAAPDFEEMASPAARKEAFFRWLAPVVVQENARLDPVRRRLARLQRTHESGRALPPQEHAFLAELADHYRAATPAADPGPTITALLRRVDGVPVRLALVQAAVESGWGTGRFAREANNYFGMWTWRHAGLVPEDRDDGANHSVAAYPDAAASVRAYLYTLDVGPAYSELRRLRAQARADGRPPCPLELAGGLTGYSERGHEYVAEIRDMLRANDDVLNAVLEEL